MSDSVAKNTGRRRALLVLAAAAVLLAVYLLDTYRLEGELGLVADQRVAEAEAYLGDEGGRVAASVVVSRAGIVVGQARGKVSVYVQRGDTGSIEGFEYYFERDGEGVWEQTGSGRCTSEQCTTEGLALMRALDS